MSVVASDVHQSEVITGTHDTWNSSGKHLEVGLFTDPLLDPSDDTPLSAFTDSEASFPGYSRQDCYPWGAVTEDESAKLYKMVGPVLHFTQTSSASPQTVYGWFAVRQDDGFGRLADRTWPGGITFENACDQLSLQITYTTAATNPGPH